MNSQIAARHKSTPLVKDSLHAVLIDDGQSSDQRLALTKISVSILLLLSLVVRIWWVIHRGTVIEGEGANYARMAENIATGKGWLGMQGHLQLFYPPLFPLLIAAVYPLVHNAELAGRLVSIAFGTFLVVPVFLIAGELYDKRVAFIAASIVALHPMYVGVSSAVYCESTYLFLLVLAMLCGIIAAKEQSYSIAIASGVLIGFAYLTRTEGLLVALFLAVLIVILGRENRKKASAIVACMVVACILVGAPYVWFLTAKTGEFRIEAKSADNFTYGQMRLAGIPWEPAFRAIDENLQPVGLSMRTELDVLSTTKFDLRTALRFVKLAARENSRNVARDLLKQNASGGFVLVGLVALGLFGTPWSRARTLQEAAVGVFLLMLFLPFLSIVTFWNTRYVLAMLLVLIIWAANGVAVIAEWGWKSVVKAISPRVWMKSTGALKLVTRVVMVAAVATLLLIAWQGIGHVEDLQSGDPTTKAAGLWLRQRIPAGLVVMDTDNLIAFYSGGTYRPFPYAAEATALRYIAANNVGILVIREKNGETSNPYYDGWVNNGIPDPQAHLLASIPSEKYGRILLYRRSQQ
jgi:4-amino-4-deoxy-L-arabinose transferase-like glycosyltransferase